MISALYYAFQNKNVLALTYVATVSVLLLPVVLNGYLPLTDLYNHAARHYIAAVGDGDPFLSQYYQYDFRWFGNSGSDAFRELLGNSLSPYVLVRVTIGFYMANLVLSVCVLSRVIHGEWRLWPLASGLLVFNGNFQWGFENFLFGAPFVIYAIAIMIASAHRSFRWRFAMISALAAFLCIVHILLCAIFAFIVLGYELQKVLQVPRPQRPAYFARHVTLATPFILSLIAFILAQSAAEQSDGSYSAFGGGIARLEVFTSVSAHSLFDMFLNPEGWERGIAIFLCVIVFLAARRSQSRLTIDPRMKGILIALLVVSLIAPSWIDGVAFIHYRTPFLLACVFIASTKFAGLSERPISGVAIAVVIVSLFLGRVYSFHNDARDYSDSTEELIALLQELPRGARMMPVTSYWTGDDYWRFYHVASVAVIERQALVPILFQGIQGLSNRKEWDGYSTPIAGPIQAEHLWYDLDVRRYIFRELNESRYENTIELYHERWNEKFTHVLALNEMAVPYLDSLPLRKVRTIGYFTLYENPQLLDAPEPPPAPDAGSTLAGG